MISSKITDRVYLIDTLALGNSGTVAAYILKGKKIALVDCGYASSHENVLKGMREIGIQPSEIDYIIPTHVHLDHGGAAGHLVRKMPRAKVLAHERAVPHLVDPTRLIQSATAVYGKETIAIFGEPLPIPQERITAIGEEMHLDLGGLSVTALHTPGHAPHQISVLVEEEKLIISADAVGMVYPGLQVMIPTTPPPSLDPEKLSHSIDELGQMESRRLLLPHYGTRTDVQGVFETTKAKTAAWIEKTRAMKKTGLQPEEMLAKLRAEVCTEAGVTEAEFPIYANAAIRTSLMGILHFLEKNP
jgi:glyoxylase-like metal-dependent hydrolase (beta-lactamase superfamily II)